MSTCLHRFTPDTNLVQTKIGAVETFAKLFFGKSKPFSVIYEPSYLGFSEEICRIFQPPPLTYHAYAPHTPYTNLLGHLFGPSSGLAWFGRFGPVWVESAPRCTLKNSSASARHFAVSSVMNSVAFVPLRLNRSSAALQVCSPSLLGAVFAGRGVLGPCL